MASAKIQVIAIGDERAVIVPLDAWTKLVERLEDLEDSYRNLWKFLVLTSESEPAAIAAIQKILERQLPGAVNVYRVAPIT